MAPDLLYWIFGIDIDDRYDSMLSVLILIVAFAAIDLFATRWIRQRRLRP